MSDIEKEIVRNENLLVVRIIGLVFIVLMLIVFGFRILENSLFGGLMFIFLSLLTAVIGFFALRHLHHRNQRMRHEFESNKALYDKK